MSIVHMDKEGIMMTMTLLQVMEWMDLERNAAILEKTDKAIAQKLRAASGGKVIFWPKSYDNIGQRASNVWHTMQWRA